MKTKETIQVIMWVKCNYDKRSNKGTRQILHANISFLKAYKLKYRLEYKKCEALAAKELLTKGAK